MSNIVRKKMTELAIDDKVQIAGIIQTVHAIEAWDDGTITAYTESDNDAVSDFSLTNDTMILCIE